MTPTQKAQSDADERPVTLTPLGYHALERFMAARQRRCPACGEEPGTPCQSVNGNVRQYYHLERYP